MDPRTPITASRLRATATAFVAIGLLVYFVLLCAAEGLMDSRGESNPLWKVGADARVHHDWVILGASHAMPLAFGGFEAQMARETGLAITNLSATGAGPLYNRFVFGEYAQAHRADNVLYVVDAFAFYSDEWNERRFADAKLLARTPWRAQTVADLGAYVLHEGVGWRAWLDYATGFSKINNHDRFKPDRWEGADKFEQSWRPSTSAVTKRIAYLYPDGTREDQLARHLAQLDALVADAQRHGARVTFVKLPVPGAFAARLPETREFDEAIVALAAARGVAWRDASGITTDPAHFFDSDHLNRRGVALVFQAALKALLTHAAPASP